MFTLSVQLACALALGAALWKLLDAEKDRSASARAVTLLLCLVMAGQALSWCWALRPAAPGELSPLPSMRDNALRLGSAACGGALAYASAAGALAAEGLVAGLLFAMLGAQAVVWLRALQAGEAMGWFLGWFLPPFIPVALALTCAAAAYVLRAPETRSRRWLIAAGLLLLWAVPGHLATWRLEYTHGLGANSLAAEAALPPAGRAERVSLAWLIPSGGKEAKFEEKQAVIDGVEVSPESLDKLSSYLRRRDYRGVFSRQALSALRQGWRFWWEPDHALEAAALSRPGRAAPDYKAALGLLRGGPMDEERYRRLEELAAAAQASPAGFEDVNTSQIIFEGFASAYARFGDEESARRWLLRVDNLWPIYEKKIEVSPVETAHDCRVEGSVLVDGLPSRTVKVGLFYVAGSTATAPGTSALSQSQYPTDAGRFSFTSLAPGTYFLALMGLPAELRGRVVNSPGFIEPTPERPVVSLPPIRVER